MTNLWTLTGVLSYYYAIGGENQNDPKPFR